MKFTTEELKKNNGEKVGVFRDWNVIATTKREFFNRENTQGAYLIWDDCNKLVFNGKVLGRITEQGKVEYIESEYRYTAGINALVGEVKPVFEDKSADNRPNITVSLGEVDLGQRTLADDILDSVFKTKLEDIL